MTTPDEPASAAAPPPPPGDDAGVARLSAAGLAAVRGFRTVFRDVSFAVGAGELMTVTGPNGSGKSTLLRIVAGLMRPSAGAVAFMPEPEDGPGPLIHYFGHQDGLKATLTVARNLGFWQRFWGGGDVGTVLERVGLDGLEPLHVGVLSAGQKRRVALARMLLVERPVWLLDEPLTALDASSEAVFGDMLGEHLAGGGLAIAATHRALPAETAVSLKLDGAA